MPPFTPGFCLFFPAFYRLGTLQVERFVARVIEDGARVMAEEAAPEGFGLRLVVRQMGQQWAEDMRPQRGQFPGMTALDVDVGSAVVQDQSRKLLQHGQYGGQAP